MCLMISAELVNDLMEEANAAMEAGDTAKKQEAADKIGAVLDSTGEAYMHYTLLKNYRDALTN